MSIDLQNKIRQNAMEMREYVTDLYEWEQEMELKEKTKAKFRKDERQKNEEAFKAAKETEIRQSKMKEEKEIQAIKEAKKNKGVDYVRDVNTIKDYYNAWDKFDVDKQLSKLEKEEERAYRPYNPYEDSKNNLRAKPKTKINVKGRRNVVSDPTQLKDKGNLHFQSLQFEKAIFCYSECLQKLDQENIPFDSLPEQKKKLRCVVLSNRAMAYLKNQETLKAIEDATESIKYDPKYGKSYYRRGQGLKKLGKYKQSLRDYKMVKTLEPTDSKADSEIRKIEAFFAKRAKQTRESMIMEYNPTVMMGSKRIEISQVAEFESQEKPQESNYLQEL